MLKTADFVAAALANHNAAKLCKQGYIEYIRNVFYQLPENDEIKEE